MVVMALTGALAVAGLTACGESDTARIRAVIERAYTTAEPENCTKLVTPEFARQAQLEDDTDAAIKSCRESAETDEPSDSVKISRVTVNEDGAEAEFTPEGGDVDGQRFTVRLIKAGTDWKLDRITDVELDRDRFEAALRDGLIRPPDALSEERADCVIENLEGVSDAEIERAIVEADPAVFTEAVTLCEGVGRRGGVRGAFEGALRRNLLQVQGLSPEQADCVLRRLRKVLSADQLERLVRSGEPSPKLREASERAGAACAPEG
jgi:hypothetical protein